MNKQYLEAGKIVNTHGIAGEVKILPWADNAEFLLCIRTFYMGGRELKVTKSRVHKGCLIAKLEGIDEVNAAMLLKNKTVLINREEAPIGEGRFFIADIIGAKVVSDEGEELGELAEVLDLPAGNVYVVKGGREILIPAVDEFIMSTDVENGIITVHLIDGM